MCILRAPVYVPHSNQGLIWAKSDGDGYGISLKWHQAFPDSAGYNLVYDIYYSTLEKDTFVEGVKAVSIDPTIFSTSIIELTPGDTYFFACRAREYDPTWYDPTSLPDMGSTKIYPSGLLTSPISASDGYLPISDAEQFPAFGVVQLGSELIRYTNLDLGAGNLLGLTRGFLDTDAREHQLDGYDGYQTHPDPLVRFWGGYEEPNGVIFQETCSFAYPNYPLTIANGYKTQTTDLLNTNLSASDTDNATFAPYDYVGWHRTNPADLLSGKCIGTYYGGEQYCADGYSGVGRQLRGVPFQTVNDQRQEMLLEQIGTGEPCVLARRLWTGIRCACYLSTTEYPEDRCPLGCYNTGFVGGFQQFFYPRRGDGRIMVRFGPTEETLKMQDAGLESTFIPDCWTLVYPAIKNRDFLIRFNEDGTEEFRYEILGVTRNKLLNTYSGAQKFRAQRVRKTNPIYQWRSIRDTSTMPASVTTSIGMAQGIAPHTHTVQVSEQIAGLAQINQMTSFSAFHEHAVINGIVQPILGHTHTIIYS